MLTISSTLLAGAPGLALAQDVADDEELDYSYLELDLVGQDIDVVDQGEGIIDDLDDGSGLALEGSLSLSENVFVYGSYSETESDVAFGSPDVFPIPAETDINRLEAGVGYHAPIAENADFVGGVGYHDIDFGDFEVGEDNDLGALLDDSSDGYAVQGGVRSQLVENLEGTLGIRYLDVEDFSNTSLMGSLLFEMTEYWHLDLAANVGDEISTYMLGVRFSPES